MTPRRLRTWTSRVAFKTLWSLDFAIEQVHVSGSQRKMLVSLSGKADRKSISHLPLTINHPLDSLLLMASYQYDKKSVRQYSPNCTLNTTCLRKGWKFTSGTARYKYGSKYAMSGYPNRRAPTAQLHGSCDFLNVVKRILIAVLFEAYWLTEWAKNKSGKNESSAD